MSDPEAPIGSPGDPVPGDPVPSEGTSDEEETTEGDALGAGAPPEEGQTQPPSGATEWWRQDPGRASAGTPPTGTPPFGTPPTGTPPFGTPTASGPPPSVPPWAGGPPWGVPPWGVPPQWYGWGPGWSGAPAQPQAAPPGPPMRRHVPWVIVGVLVAAVAMVALGLGVGYSVWGGAPTAVRRSAVGPPARVAPSFGRGGFLGVEIATSPLGIGQTSSAPSTPGARVVGVIAGSPAAKAGIVKGDTITSFGSHAVQSSLTLRVDVLSMAPGSRVKVGWVTAGGKNESATVTLAKRPATKSIG